MAKKITFDLSISLVSHNSCDLLHRCLYSIYRSTRSLEIEVFLVDNASQDNTVEMVRKKFPQIKLTASQKNNLFTKSHNQNLRQIKGKYFLVMNEDIEIPHLALDKMVAFMEKHASIGLASCRQVNEKNQTDMTCSRLPHPLIEFFASTFAGRFIRKLFTLKKIEQLLASHFYLGWNRNTVRQVKVIPGSFFLGRSQLLKQVGYFDEKLLLFYEEPDYCQRAGKAGFSSYHNGKVKIVHLRSKSIAKLPPFVRFKIVHADVLSYYQKYFGFYWCLFLWFALLPDWLYWRTKK